MVYDYHVVLAISASAAGIAGYVFYIRSILQGITKPHLFTWLVYVLIDGIVFAAQLIKGGGPGSWVTLAGEIPNLIIVFLALRIGEKHITKSDWASFVGALAGLVLWGITSNPLTAVILLTITNTFAIVPTMRKSYVNPFEESLSTWTFDIVRFGLSIAAFTSINLTTALFPAGVVTVNVLLSAIILIRRRQLGRLART